MPRSLPPEKKAIIVSCSLYRIRRTRTENNNRSPKFGTRYAESIWSCF